MSNGLTLPILNPNSSCMMDAVCAYKVLTAYDVDSEGFIEKYAKSTNQEIQTSVTSEITLEESIIKGRSDGVKEFVLKELETKKPLEIVNNILIPTLDIVGAKYESGEIFLPQLIRSASTSCIAFDIIKETIAKSSTSQTILKGKIILATVKGDIHDIGKNIVKVILENYGYEVIDLGRDVSPNLIVETAIKENVKLIGLSALMTTTVESMKLTIDLIRESKHDCKVVVGGAVLTKEYSKKIGADFYAKDAKQSADIAKEVLG